MERAFYLVKHPLIDHKMSLIRDKSTSSNYFRSLVREVTQMMMISATQDLKVDKVGIITPLTDTIGYQLADPVLVIPILRAGLGMLDAFTELIPTAKVGHIGLARDEKTLQAKAYVAKLPHINEQTQVFILDPMLATGGTLVKAIEMIKEKGGKRITYLGLVGVQQGVDYVHKTHPEVKIYLTALDAKLNAHGFILPGLGDAGDRLFGAED
jgi:uracil phosphoribosyltransferase